MARKLITASLTLAAWVTSAPAIAQSYPSKPIRLLVGFPAGGPSDVPARLIAAKMQASLGQPVTVENKTGAAGMIALKDMLAQPRDGHTLLLCSYIDAINPLIYKKVDYKLDEVVPISLVQKAYYAIAVSNALPVNVLVMPSRYENFSNSILEAMACGSVSVCRRQPNARRDGCRMQVRARLRAGAGCRARSRLCRG